MTDPADFDAFYREVRERLLVQTYALTGDRAVSRGAVRDAFVAAWHHWHRVARSADPEASVREIAWGKAQRRHGARPWHRDKDVDAATRATLDALASLGAQQRRVLVLAHLASVSMPDLAREVGQTVPATEQQLQQATAAFVLARGIPAAGVNAALEPLTAVTGQTTWPRGSLVRRTGVARRRAHTVVGVVGVVAALVLSGLFVTDPSGLRPTLAQAVEGVGVADEGGTDAEVVPDDAGGEPAELLPRSTLLAAPQVARAFPGAGWAVASTSDNSEGNGLLLPCQLERYVDPDGEAALVREFRAARQGAPVRPTAVQLTEVSSSPAAARRALRTLTGWVASCTDTEPRAQLVASRAVEGVGDEAVQLVLRDWEAPVTTSVVQVARTGSVLTATSVTSAGERTPAAAAAAGLQAAAVDGVCRVRGAGPCARTPRVTDVAPPAPRRSPAMISEIDLPPVSRVDQPWVGTDPVPARTNTAATSCDSSSFSGTFQGAAWQRSSTRTFLLPEADLPTEFGLTETVGSLPRAQAQGFVERVRDRLDTCSDDLGTDVTRIGGSAGRDTSLDAWQLTAEVSDDRSIRFFMAVMRDGTSVAQVGFVPAPGVTLRDGAFVELAERARARLGELPAYPAQGAGSRGGRS
ncbi:hypothetical protein ENKNEFLB_01176 [Nocardioides aquaticus]|uniref:DNA-directed RNA polymerase specialized sigma24 family protein n=3 Tax=Nocardioides aquaticus TaxID=160826 RepID=A0ABX8EJJ1_9ACTN|nr:hypothetical protein [Nocardioides aquaticus]QVT78798.1 hypothetical protein ENKNEFLB_01176 [Nocardioides aquaticus]